MCIIFEGHIMIYIKSHRTIIFVIQHVQHRENQKFLRTVAPSAINSSAPFEYKVTFLPSLFNKLYFPYNEKVPEMAALSLYCQPCFLPIAKSVLLRIFIVSRTRNGGITLSIQQRWHPVGQHSRSVVETQSRHAESNARPVYRKGKRRHFPVGVDKQLARRQGVWLCLVKGLEALVG